MGEIKTFEDLEVWKKGCQLSVEIITQFQTFPITALKDQIQRSVLSIPSNIAEGAEKDSTADYLRFLRYSKGSCGELRTQLYIAQRVNEQLNINTKLDLPKNIEETKIISRMLQALINSLNSKKR